MRASRPRPFPSLSTSAGRSAARCYWRIAASALTSYIPSADAQPARLLLAHAMVRTGATAFACAAVKFEARGGDRGGPVRARHDATEDPSGHGAGDRH
jgi:hypothetical protein